MAAQLVDRVKCKAKRPLVKLCSSENSDMLVRVASGIEGPLSVTSLYGRY